MRTYIVAASILVSGTVAYLLFSGGDSSAPTSRPDDAPKQTRQVESRELANSVVRPRRMRAPIRASAASDAAPGSQAMPNAPGTRADRNARRAKMFDAFDADGDGRLSEEERDALRASRSQRRQDRQLEFFDSNGDGILDEDERAVQEQARLEMRAERVSAVLSETDTDADGKLSQGEAASGNRRMQRLLRDFDDVDTDSDGLVSTEELQAAMAARRGQHRGRPPAGEDAP